MLTIKDYIASEKLANSVGLGGMPHVFGASTKPQNIIPIEISKGMKTACKACKEKLGLTSDVLEKETFKLVEKTNPETSEKYFVIE